MCFDGEESGIYSNLMFIQVDKASSDLRHTNVRLKETLTSVKSHIYTNNVTFLDLKGNIYLSEA